MDASNPIQLIAFKLLGIAIALAATIAPFSPAAPETAFYYWANFYGIDRTAFLETMRCESDFDPHAIGPMGEVGIVQIYLPAHPEVTRAEALDPDFSISWAARNWKDGHARWWVCYRKMRGKAAASV